MKNVFLIVLMILTSNTYGMDSSEEYSCESNKSFLGTMIEGMRNHTQINGRSGYYTSAFRFVLKKNNSGSFNYTFMGEKAFCRRGEQCAGPYSIYSGKTQVAMDNETISSVVNDLIHFEINTESGECHARILDIRINKKLRKFDGLLSK